MVCCPCQVAGNQSEAVHRRQIMGEGPTYRERQKGRVPCREYGDEMAAVSLAIHLMTQHGQMAEAQQSWRNPATGDRPRKFKMAFLSKV